ncbi:MAG: hypothetical protein GY694_13660, partial [Gammaproteobacteria bacterium]|nr:hypothetical protein [Gammaproteobacteria bacterium]
MEKFLTQRRHRVVVDGEYSEFSDVDSGVPQGTVLGLLLFLTHINDLPSHVKSTVRLFADDCLLYRVIRGECDLNILQDDLKALEDWAKTWGMRFNATKCYKMTLHRGTNKLSKFYVLNDHILKQVNETPYLGVTIQDNLKWSTHINKITKSANQSLGFIKRNLKYCNSHFKETAYISLVRSLLEYSCTVWDPHQEEYIQKIEKVQRRAARFVQNDYRRYSSVTDMMNNLGWTPL